jgi:hypothetical protein
MSDLHGSEKYDGSSSDEAGTQPEVFERPKGTFSSELGVKVYSNLQQRSSWGLLQPVHAGHYAWICLLHVG